MVCKSVFSFSTKSSVVIILPSTNDVCFVLVKSNIVKLSNNSIKLASCSGSGCGSGSGSGSPYVANLSVLSLAVSVLLVMLNMEASVLSIEPLIFCCVVWIVTSIVLNNPVNNIALPSYLVVNPKSVSIFFTISWTK